MDNMEQFSELVEQLLHSRQQELKATMMRLQQEAWTKSNAYLARLDSDQMPQASEKDDTSSSSSQCGQKQSHDGYGGMVRGSSCGGGHDWTHNGGIYGKDGGIQFKSQSHGGHGQS